MYSKIYVRRSNKCSGILLIQVKLIFNEIVIVKM